MTRTRFFTATSLDGFIADADDSLDWLFEVEGEGFARFTAFFAGVGALAMGATTYEWIVEHDRLLERPGKWTEYYGTTPAWVFTHRDLPAVPGADITFVRDDVRPVHEAMTAALRGRDIRLGGGEPVGCFADHGLPDAWCRASPR
ncbi:hypothetical protein ABZZ36_33390 [Actinacidiphila glaucinigra]|uniref:dihydrofolate reductase family protein n=1 Tax=Actinacidiphila glaucinigra TaxID=235986 RepID=UPI0033AE18A3